MIGDHREAEAFERRPEILREPVGGKRHGNGRDSGSHIVIHIAAGLSTVLRLAHDPFVSSEVETPFGLVSSRGASRLRSMRTGRSEEHTSELQSLMRISYAVFCFKKNTPNIEQNLI